MAGRSAVKHPEEIRMFRTECGRVHRYEARIRAIRQERETLLWRMSGCRVQSYDGVRGHGDAPIEYGKYVEEREQLKEEEEQLLKKIRNVEACLAAVETMNDRICLWRIYGEKDSLKETAEMAGMQPQSLYRRLRACLDAVFDQKELRVGMSGTGDL